MRHGNACIGAAAGRLAGAVSAAVLQYLVFRDLPPLENWKLQIRPGHDFRPTAVRKLIRGAGAYRDETERRKKTNAASASAGAWNTRVERIQAYLQDSMGTIAGK